MRKPAFTNKVNRGLTKILKHSDNLYKQTVELSEDLDAKDRSDIRTAIKWMNGQRDWYNDR
jgi:hypothetical protein|tara:strand:+ start:1965 stop:2147 length:183 start_codon:yes stop_codon:yes gene_type:complete